MGYTDVPEDYVGPMLLAATRDIPHGATVRKVTGECKYTLHRELTVWGRIEGSTEDVTVIHAQEGCVFLIGDNGNISVFPPNKLLVWLDSNDAAL
jgi:hypothetical protein